MSAVINRCRHSYLWNVVRSVLEEQRQRQTLIQEELSFFVYRTDTNGVLASGIFGYEEAKRRADLIRKQQGLPWSVVKFKAERKVQQQVPTRQFGIGSNGRSFTNARGQTSRVDFAKRVNPSKGRRFRGYTDLQGNYHDID
jgi:hypothetical protein